MKTAKDKIAYIKTRLEAIEHQPAAAFIVRAEDARLLLDSLQWESSLKTELLQLQEQWVRERAFYIEALDRITKLTDGRLAAETAKNAMAAAKESTEEFFRIKSWPRKG